MLERLAGQGVDRATVTLHVGIGTFRPVTAENVEEHRMDFERWRIPAVTAAQVTAAKAAGGRVVAVGPTSAHTGKRRRATGGFWRGAGALGSVHPSTVRFPRRGRDGHQLPPAQIYARHDISAFAGREFVREASRARCRFFSCGDAMLIL